VKVAGADAANVATFGDYCRTHCHGGVAEGIARDLFKPDDTTVLSGGTAVADAIDTTLLASPSFGDYHRRHCHGGVAESLARSLFRDSKQLVSSAKPSVAAAENALARPSFGDYHRRHCHGGVAESTARSLFPQQQGGQKIGDVVEKEWRKFDFPHTPSVASWLLSAPTWTLTIDQPCSGTAVADAIDAIEFERTPFPRSPSVGAWLRSPTSRERASMAQSLEAATKGPGQEASSSSKPGRRPSQIATDEAEEAARVAWPRTPFVLSPSVGAWLQAAPKTARLRLTELATQEPQKAADDTSIPFCHSPSVGAWLRSAPKGARNELARLNEVIPSATGTPVADAIDVQAQPAAAAAATPFPLSPSVGAWLHSKPVRLNLDAALAAALEEPEAPGSTELEPSQVYVMDLMERIASKGLPKPQLRGDFRSLRPSFFDSIHALFPQIERPSRPEISSTRDLTPAVDLEPVRPEMSSTSGPVRAASPRQRSSDARFRTNAGATREQVMSFAQSLTSSIFRNSNTLAMQRTLSQPQFRRPRSPLTAGSSNSSLPAPAPFATTSFSSSAPVPALSLSSTTAPVQQATLPPRPAFRKQHSPIPAEDGAFFD